MEFYRVFENGTNLTVGYYEDEEMANKKAQENDFCEVEPCKLILKSTAAEKNQ